MDTSKIVIAVVVLLLLGGGAFFYFQNQEGMMSNTNQSQVVQSMQPAASSEPRASGQNMASDTGTMEGNVKEFTVDGSNFKFMPATMTVNKGDTVRVVFRNTGGFHDFVIDEFEGAKTKQIGANASETVEFVADKSGNFEYYCSVGNHRGMGMKGTLTVL